MRRVLLIVVIDVVLWALLIFAAIGVWTVAAHAAVSPRTYARELAASRYGWTGYEWRALDAIVWPESRWNPCARWPSTIDCGYAGSNSCGIPQRNPCPVAWRGRLAASWREQVVELLRYVRGRYGSPSRALSFRLSRGWY